MKFQLKQLTLLFALPVILFGEAADHLIFKRIALAPTNAEMVVIHNPTNQDIPLGNYYITDAVNQSSLKYYYNLPDSSDFWSGDSSDFIARFPDITLGAGDDLILGLHNEEYYTRYYSDTPDLVLFGDMLNAIDGQMTISSGPASFSFDILQNPEVLILFHWDGISTIVQDVDYFLWGDNNHAISKTGISDYFSDTYVLNQYYMPSIGDHKVYFRLFSNETESTLIDGNGITGHDETSENFALSWHIIDNVPQFSYTSDHLIFKQLVIAPTKAEKVAIFNPTIHDIELSNYYLTDAVNNFTSKYYYNLPFGVDYWSGSSFSDFIARFPDITISAGETITLGLHDVSDYFDYYSTNPDLTLMDDMLNAIDGQPSKPTNPNFDLLQNPEVLILFYWDGASEVVQDVDYFLWGNTSNAVDKSLITGYFPDTPKENQSYMPINYEENKLYHRKSNSEAEFFRTGGNGITGHDETCEDFTSEWNVVYNSNQIAAISDIFENYDPDTDYTDCPVELIVEGVIVEFADIRPKGGPQNITIEDNEGYRISLTVWDWDVASSFIGPMVDPYNPAMYVIQASGCLDYYSGWQLEILAPENIIEHSIYNTEGEFVIGDVVIAKIEPAPYVIIPSMGERLDFTYSFPSNSRVVVRIFDLSGRFVTSLVDRYYSQPGTVLRQQDNSEWDGRDHLGQIVPPGTYFMNIETNNFSTGKTSMDTAPVVVGVKF